ncbi:MAG: hypothetical protein F7B06_09320 [Opitutae bacterium]|nr:hypothetical protein [Opitutae bacterium]
MGKPRKSTRYGGRLTLIFAMGIVAHLGIWSLFRVDPKHDQPEPGRGAFVFHQSGDQQLHGELLLGRAFLFDSEPIFLPTSRNYSGPVKTDASLWEPEVDLSKPFGPDIRLDDSILLAEARSTARVAHPEELLQNLSGDFFSEFGAVKPVWPSVEQNGLFVQATDAKGNVVVESFLSLETTPSFSLVAGPVVFAILHTPFGLGGEPFLVNPSGDEETDTYLQKILLEQVRPLLQGLTGYFHVKIGP